MSKAVGSAGRASRARATLRAATAKRKRAEAGLETAADGAVIGRDPRRLSAGELRELGHRGKPLLQAMRRRCVDCCGGKVDEVRRCTAVACPLWPYRMGTDPWRAEPTRTKAERPPAAAPAPAAAAASPAESTPARPRLPAAPGAAPLAGVDAALPATAMPDPAVKRKRRPGGPSPTSPIAVSESAGEPTPLRPPAAVRRSRRDAELEATPLLPFLDVQA